MEDIKSSTNFYGKAPVEERAYGRFRALFGLGLAALAVTATAANGAQAQTLDGSRLGLELSVGTSGQIAAAFRPKTPAHVMGENALLGAVQAGKVGFNSELGAGSAAEYIEVTVPLEAGTPLNQGVVGDLQAICAYPATGEKAACLVMNIRFKSHEGASPDSRLPDIRNPATGDMPRSVARRVTTDPVMIGRITLQDPAINKLAQEVAVNFTRPKAEELRTRVVNSVFGLVGARPDPQHPLTDWSATSHIVQLAQEDMRPITFR